MASSSGSGKVEKLIRGLANVVGLDESSSSFEVLKSVAETLGCSVRKDGTVALEDDEEPAGRGAKRAKLDGGSGGKAHQPGSSSGDELQDVGVEGEEEGSSDSDGEDGVETADLSVEPITVNDPRKPAEVQGQEQIADGEGLFQWLISPVDVETFDEAIEELQPLLVSRPHNRQYFKGLFSKAEVDRLLREKALQYQYNIDVVSYSKSGRRENFNQNGEEPLPGGRAAEQADASVVWRRFDKEGCSVRILHPQRYSDTLWRVLARLEDFFQCCVGCNAYLTPAGSQGFAPHWDDIDAYVLQLEGKKRWRLHAPTDPAHVLPRFSSRDFEQEELGECVLDEVLEPGDLLYMPRGLIHQAEALPDAHSLHLTISTNQLRTWADLLTQALPRAVQLAAQEHVALRRSLPREAFNFMGLMNEPGGGEDDDDEEPQGESEGAVVQQMRAAFQSEALSCMEMVTRCLPLDSAVDQMAVQFLKARLPPIAVTPRAGSSKAAGKQLPGSTRVRLLRPRIARLVVEDGEGGESVAVVYHSLTNSRQQHASRQAGGETKLDDVEEEAGAVEFPIECAEVLEALLTSGPGAEVAVADLPPVEGCDIDAKGVAQALVEVGLLEVA